MISGAHVMIFTRDEAADRAFLRDMLEIPCMDAGGGWLIFKLPPAELGVHGGERNGFHELYLICDDARRRNGRDARRSKGVICAETIKPAAWGRSTSSSPSRRRQARPVRGAPRAALTGREPPFALGARHAFSRPGQDLHLLRRGRARRGQLPARKVRRIWRARRRRGRQGRRYRVRSGRRPQHADRLSLHPAFPRAARQGRIGQQPHRRRRQGSGDQGSGRHPDPRRRRGTLAARRPDQGRPAAALPQGRRRRARQRQLQDLDQPRPAPAWPGLAGRGNVGLAAAEIARRRRPRRPAQRGQIDLPQPHHQRRRQGRRISVHHASPAAWAWFATRAASSCWPISPG